MPDLTQFTDEQLALALMQRRIAKGEPLCIDGSRDEPCLTIALTDGKLALELIIGRQRYRIRQDDLQYLALMTELAMTNLTEARAELAEAKANEQ